jgi:hypothetical protein
MVRSGPRRLGGLVLPHDAAWDRAACIVVSLAMAVGLAVFLGLPTDPDRLRQFAPEHTAMFAMVDSRPLRMAYIAFLATLIAGALALGLVAPARRGALRGRPGLQALLGLLVIVAVVLCMPALVVQPPAPGWRALAMSALVPAYAAAVAVLAWHRRLPRGVVPVVTGIVVLLMLLPAATDLPERVSVPLLPWVDMHMAALFSGGQLLADGYRLFADVSISYGTLTPILLGGLARLGISPALLRFVQLAELFQAITLGLFLLAAWQRARGLPTAGRTAALLLTTLVVSPFLSTASYAVVFANQSGFRFVMLPIAVLMLTGLERWPLVRATALAAAFVILALLHNLETGIAILVGLGLAWLIQAREAGWRIAALALLTGLACAALALGAALLLHRVALGSWPTLDLSAGTNLFRQFGAGFGGLAPPFRVVAFVVFGHAGYLLVTALASVLRGRGERPTAASAGIAGILLAWAPYYMNRPDDWNFWSFLALYTLLIAPRLFARETRPTLIALASLVLLVPIPLNHARTDVVRLLDAADMQVDPRCASGLAMTPAACQENRARAAELLRLAGPGDVLVMSGTPFLMQRLTRLRPLIAPLDLYSAALTETDLTAIGRRIAAAAPLAVLLDRPAGSAVATAIPAPVLSIHRRIAAQAGYAPCPAIGATYWQVWLPSGACNAASPAAMTLQKRLVGP